MIIIENGRIVTPDKILEGHVLVIEGDMIKTILPKEDYQKAAEDEFVDAKGGYLVPGFIDLHSDYIEGMAAPRPLSMMDFEMAVRESERILLCHGITTMFHSLSVMKHQVFGANKMRNFEFVKPLMEVIRGVNSEEHLIRHRLHLRLEMDMVEEIDEVVALIEEKNVDLLSIMDHTPGQGQYRDLEVYRNTVQGYHKYSNEETDEIVTKNTTKEKFTWETIQDFVQLAQRHHLAVASHDDDTAEKVDMMQELGIKISEFPTTMEAAREAKAMEMWTVAGAPNPLLGGSHSGNLNVSEGVEAGVIDILCSDYYPAALLHSVFLLTRSEVRTLPEAVQMVTLSPAKAVGIDKEYGSLEQGKKADVLILRENNGFPHVATAFVDGQLVWKGCYRNEKN